jgi:hypothetical protein
MAEAPRDKMPVATTPRQGLRAIVVAVGALVALLVAGTYWWRARSAVEPVVVAPRPTASAGPTTIVDPISPERPARIDPVPRAKAADWSKARPAFQSSRSAAERGGIEPCATQEVDTSTFEPWSRLSQGQLLVPREGVDAAGRFVLVIHLHGSDPVRRELIQSGQRFVLYAITLDVNRSYAPLFSGRGLDAMVAEVEAVLSKQTGKPARAARLVLSAWSAGFVGVQAALPQTGGPEIAGVILIDGLHAPRKDRSAFEAQLKPFVEYATRAALAERFMYVSHSSIDSPDFASTTECAHYVIAELGGKPQPVRRDDRFGLELVEYFSRGDFHVRGYAGNDKADHCAQLALLRDAYAALGRRWANR